MKVFHAYLYFQLNKTPIGEFKTKRQSLPPKPKTPIFGPQQSLVER